MSNANARALDWLTQRAYEGRGVVVLSVTENGDVGVWIGVPKGSEPALGVGDTVADAVFSAIRKAES